jgi:hypothetical protein
VPSRLAAHVQLTSKHLLADVPRYGRDRLVVHSMQSIPSSSIHSRNHGIELVASVPTSQALPPGPRFRSRIVRSLDHG